MKKILLLEGKPAISREYLLYLEQDFVLVEKGETYEVEEIVGIVVRSVVQVTQKLIDTYGNLKYVLRVGIGLDTIDVKYCEQRGIKVFNTPGANSDAVADLALWGTLSLLRKTKQLQRNLQEGKDVSRFEYSK